MYLNYLYLQNFVVSYLKLSTVKFYRFVSEFRKKYYKHECHQKFASSYYPKILFTEVCKLLVLLVFKNFENNVCVWNLWLAVIV